MNKFKQILAGTALSILAFNVMALPSVSGTLSMTGASFACATPPPVIGPFVVGTDANQGSCIQTNDGTFATGLDFDFFGTDRFRTTLGDGSFAGLAGQLGDITDFQFDPFNSPIANFLSVNIFTFDLNNVSRIASSDPSRFISLVGDGIVSASGYDDTAASWRLSANTTGSGIFSWSATITTTTVPEPSVLALLALGLIGFGARRRV